MHIKQDRLNMERDTRGNRSWLLLTIAAVVVALVAALLS